MRNHYADVILFNQTVQHAKRQIGIIELADDVAGSVVDEPAVVQCRNELIRRRIRKSVREKAPDTFSRSSGSVHPIVNEPFLNLFPQFPADCRAVGYAASDQAKSGAESIIRPSDHCLDDRFWSGMEFKRELDDLSPRALHRIVNSML